VDGMGYPIFRWGNQGGEFSAFEAWGHRNHRLFRGKKMVYQASWLKAVMRLQLVILADCFMPEQQHARLVPQEFCGGISSMEYSMFGSLWLCDSQRFAIQALMG